MEAMKGKMEFLPDAGHQALLRGEQAPTSDGTVRCPWIDVGRDHPLRNDPDLTAHGNAIPGGNLGPDLIETGLPPRFIDRFKKWHPQSQNCLPDDTERRRQIVTGRIA